MPSFLRIAFVLATLLVDFQPAFPQVIADTLYRENVEYEDGKISIDFDQTPLEVALNAIQAKTGLQISVPPATESRLLNLRLSRLPLEPAVRSLISSIGFRSFALVYDGEGLPIRVVVLEARPEARVTPTADLRVGHSAEPVVEPLEAEERDQLQKALERWGELRLADRTRIEERLKTLPPSEDRDQLVKEYGRQLLGIKN